MVTIYVLSLHKLNTTIHSNIKFIIIAYSHNLHFGICYKKLQKQDYNSFHHNLTLQKFHTKDAHRLHCRSLCLSVLLKNMNPYYNIIPCFEKKSKTTLKICAMSKQSLWFFIVNTSRSSYLFLKLRVSSSLPFFSYFLELSPFELSQVTSS
jgi:hypothetical protein